jgi:hypothetical protein
MEDPRSMTAPTTKMTYSKRWTWKMKMMVKMKTNISMRKKVKRTHIKFTITFLVVQIILQLGNEILRNLGVEDPIDDVAVFFR